ncbi:MAG: T9SS type A sorting domain-containing protein [Bacteroidota bacterium]
MKKVLFLLFLCCCLGNYKTIAQTQISGGLFENTNWTLAESPYLVTGDVVVFPGVSLIIEAGVEIRFASETGLELRAGSLYVEGTENEKVVFTLDASDPMSAPKWKGIQNTSLEGQEIVVDIEHATIEYAQTGINYGRGFADRSVLGSTFRFNERAIYDGGQGYNWITVTDSEFHQNKIGMQGRLSAINSTFTNNEVGFANPHTFSNINSGGRLINCLFQDNYLAVGSIGQIITIAIMENSVFENNYMCFNGYWLNADECSFSGSDSIAIAFQKGEVKNNTFTDNETGIEVNIFNNSMTIKDNEIVANTVGIKIDGPGAAIFDNTICNNSAQDALLTTNQAIDLNFNCWCTTDLITIASQVTDAFDDAALGIASFDSININCLNELVYPGDANHDGVANAWDMLHLGLAYGFSGPARSNGHENWAGQSADDWADDFPDKVNAKHADCNGDGIVDELDLAILEQHYGKSHQSNATYDPPMPIANLELSISDIIPDPAQEQLRLDFDLSAVDGMVDNLYGIALRLEANTPFFKNNSSQLLTQNGWMGSSQDLSVMVKELPAEQAIEVAIVRTDHQAMSGMGALFSLLFEVTEAAQTQEIVFEVQDIIAISDAGEYWGIDDVSASTVLTSIGTPDQPAIRISPNPTTDYLQIERGEAAINSIQLMNTQGQILRNWLPSENLLLVGDLPTGVYFIVFETEQTSVVERVVKN